MFVVTGTGRCGTGYVSALLNACSVSTGHQDVIRHEHTLGRTPIDWRDYEGEVSFEAVPMLPTLPSGTPIVLITRDPLHVIASYLGTGVFCDSMRHDYGFFSAVLDWKFPSVLAHHTPIERAAAFWVEWNQAALPYTRAVYRVESLDPAALFLALGLSDRYDPDAITSIPHDVNSQEKQRCVEVWWDDLPFSLRSQVRLLARELGY